MNTLITPWTNLMLHQTQRCHHLAWFLYGCLEREQVLNLDACVAWWAPGRWPAFTPIHPQARSRSAAWMKRSRDLTWPVRWPSP